MEIYSLASPPFDAPRRRWRASQLSLVLIAVRHDSWLRETSGAKKARDLRPIYAQGP